MQLGKKNFMCKESIKTIGKNTLVQLSIGTVIVLMFTTWKANNYFHSITDSIKDVGTEVKAFKGEAAVQIQALSEDVAELKQEVEEHSH